MSRTVERLADFVECRATALGDGLREIRLIPDGETRTSKGTLRLDPAGAAEIIAAFETHRTPLVVDWEHESVGGGRAPAAGWIETLYYEPGRGALRTGQVE